MRKSERRSMSPSDRSALEFCVVYSMRLEGMMATLLNRLDRLSSWALVVLGAAVVTAAAPVLAGLAIVCLATYKLACQPGVAAAEASASMGRWQALFRKMGDMNEVDLAAAIREVEKQDTPAIGGLCLAAHRAASVQLALDVDVLPTLTRWQKALAYFSGGPT